MMLWVSRQKIAKWPTKKNNMRMIGKWQKPLTFKAQNAVKKATVNKRVL